jgi:hypothetical protein
VDCVGESEGTSAKAVAEIARNAAIPASVIRLSTMQLLIMAILRFDVSTPTEEYNPIQRRLPRSTLRRAVPTESQAQTSSPENFDNVGVAQAGKPVPINFETAADRPAEIWAESTWYPSPILSCDAPARPL